MSKHRRKRKHRREEEEQSLQPVSVQNNGENNQFNLNSLSSLIGNVDENQINSLLSSLNINLNDSTLEDGKNENNGVNNVEDRGLLLLNALKPLLNAEKTQILETIMQIYSIGKVISK